MRAMPNREVQNLISTRAISAGCLVAGLLLVLLSVGCSSVGPERVPRDQFDYNAAIAQSEQQQLLANLIRLRYSETPTFLAVNSVISQYSRTASVNANAGSNTAITGENSAGIGGRAIWTDTPTITYVPISGQKFSQNLLTPLPPSALFGMMQSGWPATIVFRVSIWSMNDLHNDIARPSRRRQADTEFFEMLDIWARLREEGAIAIKGMTRSVVSDEITLFIRPDLSPEGRQDMERFKALLNIDASATEFPLSFGLIPEQPDAIAVLSGSIWDIMLNLAWQFNVPPEHVKDGRTGSTFESERHNGVPPIEVHFSTEKPQQAFVSVFAHDYWFFLDQNDRLSKRTFSFLQLLLTLAETGVPDRSPVVTISN
jgi:hypothetical protein